MNHAEKLIIQTLDNAGIPKENVLRIYSELDNCTTCTQDLILFTNAKGFYSFELNDVGKRLWKETIQQLF